MKKYIVLWWKMRELTRFYKSKHPKDASLLDMALRMTEAKKRETELINWVKSQNFSDRFRDLIIKSLS